MGEGLWYGHATDITIYGRITMSDFEAGKLLVHSCLVCISSSKDDETTHRLVDQLEMVQRRAAMSVTGYYHNT